MRNSRFTESQIVAILNQAEAGQPVTGSASSGWGSVAEMGQKQATCQAPENDARPYWLERKQLAVRRSCPLSKYQRTVGVPFRAHLVDKATCNRVKGV